MCMEGSQMQGWPNAYVSLGQYNWNIAEMAVKLQNHNQHLNCLWDFHISSLNLNPSILAADQYRSFANSADPDEMAHNEPSHQDLHFAALLLIFDWNPR